VDRACQGRAIDESAVLRRRFLNVFPSRRYQALAHPTREEEPVQDGRNYWWLSGPSFFWPCSWQGWLITAAALVLFGLSQGLQIQGAPLSLTERTLCSVVIFGAFYGVYCLKSGPPQTVKKEPVMLPLQDKDGTGWHVAIRYQTGHERRIDGFATENEALDWIISNAQEIDKQPP
jgi:hypothetical protein